MIVDHLTSAGFQYDMFVVEKKVEKWQTWSSDLCTDKRVMKLLQCFHKQGMYVCYCQVLKIVVLEQDGIINGSKVTI